MRPGLGITSYAHLVDTEEPFRICSIDPDG